MTTNSQKTHTKLYIFISVGQVLVKNSTTARKTLKNIDKMNKTYQKQAVITMYNRAKYHPHRTAKMQEAMRIYFRWMKKNSIITHQTRKTN